MKLAYIYSKETPTSPNQLTLLLGNKQCGYTTQVGRLEVHGFKHLS